MDLQASKLPPSFPYAPKECKAVADTFFECFTKLSIKENNNDTEAGNRGLSQCLKEMKKYSDCMEAFEKKKPPRLMRVSNIIYEWIRI